MYGTNKATLTTCTQSAGFTIVKGDNGMAMARKRGQTGNGLQVLLP